MDNTSKSSEERVFNRRLLLFPLIVSNFAAGALPLLISLLLIDIGNTFNTSVGVTGQINSTYSIAAVVFALLMAAFSVRFNHKSLLLVGLVLINVSAVGCYLSVNFPMMLVSYTLSGFGWAMISPMAITMVGEHSTLEKRASAVGWIIAGGALVYFVGAPVIALAANFGSWQFAILAFILPVSLSGLVLAGIGLPSVKKSQNKNLHQSHSYLNDFKVVLANRSAFSCFVGDFFRAASFVAILLFAASFGRERFQHSRELTSIVILTAALCYTVGSLTCGAMVGRLGRKNSTVLSILLAGALTIAYVFAPSELLYVALLFSATWFFGAGTASANSLSLEQVPNLRGTMMSLDTAAINLGAAFGTAVAGLALAYSSYEGLSVALGALGMISALVFKGFSKDPTRKIAEAT
jgi:predicted MFS family arabinose efflux permease